jgi:nanoRNase/pAp phosphatase (c-di-AMP/oligoRNAs hydrolase)
VGSLLLKYGGGGHHQVGTCQVNYPDADRVINEVVEKLKE